VAHKSLPGNLKLLDYEESEYDPNVLVLMKEWDRAIVANIWFRLIFLNEELAKLGSERT
jgi:hypothetical protein